MRPRSLSPLLVIVLAGACSAIDDFSRFKFVSDGGATDMVGPPGFGDPCTAGSCQAAAGAPALTCVTNFNGRTAPGGICTQGCAPLLASTCSELQPEASCITVEGQNVCMPTCNPSLGRGCRLGYSCCANRNTTTGPGNCAPPDTDFCR